MCSGAKRKPTQTGFNMVNGFEKGDGDISVLLELSARNDLIGFKRAVEEEGGNIDEPGLWYGRRIGSKGMGLEERTTLMVAALYGSKDVLNYILGTRRADVNRGCGSDGVTALHCAIAGGSASCPEVVKLLLDASADPKSVDAAGNCPGDLIPLVFKSGFNSRRKALEIMLKVDTSDDTCILPDQIVNGMEGLEQLEISTPRSSKDGTEKKEYPVDLTLPDIKNGIYGTDEFRMYTFKVKPCSRAYSHDWTECPFVHPGENARRRDPRRYHYNCAPCPEFRKGTCRQGDACEYAHGIFECWLHPAQYRTRLCKDETNCTRRVCFFAHKPEELRPLHASAGSAVPSPRSYSANVLTQEVGSVSPLALGSPSVMIPSASTPPLTPSGPSSPMSRWQNQANIIPTLQLSTSRLKSALSARGMDLDMEMLEHESIRCRQQQLLDEVSGFASPSRWNNGLSTALAFATPGDLPGEFNRRGVEPANLEDVLGSIDPATLSQLQGLSLDALAPQLQSPGGLQISHNMNQQLCSTHPFSFSSSPVRTPPSFGIDPFGVGGAAALSSRSAAFAKQRSHSFVDRSAVNRYTGLSSPVSSAAMIPSNLSDWGSPDGKLDWGIQGEELHKMRKSASFGFRSNGSGSGSATVPMPGTVDEPDVSWVHSLVKDTSPVKPGQLDFEEQQQQQCHLTTSGSEMLPAWVEQLYSEQKQLVA